LGFLTKENAQKSRKREDGEVDLSIIVKRSRECWAAVSFCRNYCQKKEEGRGKKEGRIGKGEGNAREGKRRKGRK
jgi:hypothetical protein